MNRQTTIRRISTGNGRDMKKLLICVVLVVSMLFSSVYAEPSSLWAVGVSTA